MMSRQSPLIIYPDSTVLLPPRYYGSIEWYAVMAAYGASAVDYGMPFNKREKATHRCDIADTHGPLSLTFPIEKPVDHTGRLLWSDIRVSPHGEWWNVHRVSLESAYGRTPFFEFYIDRFMPVLRRGVLSDYPLLADVDSYIDSQIRDILGIAPDRYCRPDSVTVDRRGDDFRLASYKPYYQVRSGSLGFMGGLSVLDLIFNLGPESPVYLRKMITDMASSGVI